MSTPVPKIPLLIATTNEGKARELMLSLEELSFLDMKTLHDLPAAPEENALLKARYYSEQTGMLTLADEDGAVALSNPLDNTATVAYGDNRLLEMHYVLFNRFGPKTFVLPLALIVKNGKILLNLRNDPYNPDLHGKWEFPGGGMDFGETIAQNVIREAKEETGYEVEIVHQFEKFSYFPAARADKHLYFHLFLLPILCKITGGKEEIQDTEVLEMRWFGLDEVVNQDMIENNKTMFVSILPELKQYA